MAHEVAQQAPRRPAAIQHYNQALAYYQQGHLDDAIREFQAALRVEPGNAAIRTGLGWAYERQGHRHQAILEWQRAAKAGSPLARQALAGAGVGMERASLKPPRAWYRFSAAVMVLVVGLFWGLMPAWSPLAGWGLSQLSLSFPGAYSGNLIAFISMRNGNKEIYVMDVDGSNPRRLTNNRTADDQPAWSPDRQHIAYVSGSTGKTSIYIMDANGSNQRRLTNPAGSNYDTNPAWSPDGERIVFMGYRNGSTGIHVALVDGSNSYQVSTALGCHDPAWSPDGKQIAFGDSNAIYVMNADGSALRTLISNSGQDPRPAWSPDGQYIAFTSTVNALGAIFIVNADGSGLHPLIDNVVAENKPAWSPDGQQIAFATNRDKNNEIYAVNIDGSNVRRLTNHAAAETAPAWQSAPVTAVAQAPTQRAATRVAPAPTQAPVIAVTEVVVEATVAVQATIGVQATQVVEPVSAASASTGQVAFASYRDGNAEIYVMYGDGSGLRRLTRNNNNDQAPAWSPDGRQIAYIADPEGTLDIYVMNADGSNGRRLSKSGSNYSPAWSPDGRQIVFSSCGDARCHLYVVNVDGSNLQRLTNEPEETNEWSAAWSPDGRRIAYSANPGTAPFIGIMNANGTTAQLPFSGGGDPLKLGWSPDGTRITFGTGTGNAWKVYVMNADGTNLRCLTTAGHQDSDPSWLPDNQHIAFSSQRDGATDYQIYVMDANGANAYRLTNGPKANFSPAWRLAETVAVAEATTAATEAALVPTEVPPTQTRVPPTTAKMPLLTGAGTCVPDQGNIIFMVRNAGQSQATAEYKVDDPTSTTREANILSLAAGDTATITVPLKGISGMYTLTVYSYDQPNIIVKVPCQATTRATSAKVPPTKTKIPPTKARVSPTNTPGLGGLTVETVCTPERTLFIVTNTGAAMTADAVYMITDSSATMQKAGAIRLAAGESIPIDVDMRNVKGVLTLYVPDYQVKLAATCAAAAPTKMPLPTNTPASALVGVGRCSGKVATFTITNNGGNMTAPQVYVVTDETGKITARGAITLASGRSKTIPLNGVSGKLTLSMPGVGLSVETTCASPTPTPMAVAAGSCRLGGQLLIGADAAYPPFENLNTATNTVEGFDVDLLNAIGAKLGFTPVFQNTPFDTIFTNLAAGQFDMIMSAATITEERSKTVSFSDPYFVAGQVIVVRKGDETRIKSAADLVGKKIGVQLGTSGAEMAKSIQNAPLYPFPTMPEAFLALANKVIDVVIGDNATVYSVLPSQANLNLVVSGEPINPEYYGIAMRKACAGSLSALNEGLMAVIADGTYATIYRKWMGSEPPVAFQAGGMGIGSSLEGGTQPPAATPAPVVVAGPSSLIAVSSKQGGVSSIFVMNLDGSNSRRLTDSGGNEYDASWSPDGKQIVFTSDVGGHFQIYVINADGSGLRRLTNNTDTGAIEFLPCWSPDGKQIAFTAFQNSTMQIYVMNADGSNLHRLTNETTNEVSAAWSPDGKLLAFGSSRDGNAHITLMNADGSNIHRLTTTTGVGIEAAPAWSPDGKQLVFSLDETGSNQASELYVVNVDGSNLHRLTSSGSRKYDPSWSPDGRYIAYAVEQDSVSRVYVMNADGSNPHPLLDANAEGNSLAWAPALAQANAGTSSTPGASVVATATTAAATPKTKTCTVTASRAANVRSVPDVTGTIMDTLNPGQSIQVDGYRQGMDGYIWYRRSDGFWVRADMISVDVGCDIPLVQP